MMLSSRPKNSRKKGAPATKMDTQKPASMSIRIKTSGRPLHTLLVSIFLATTSMAPLSRMATHRAPQKMSWKVVVEPTQVATRVAAS